MTFNSFPVFLEVAPAIAHGMRILAHDERARIGALGRVFDDVGNTWIHGTNKVRAQGVAIPISANALLTNGTFIVNRSRGIIGPYPTGHGCFVRAVTSFITHAPGDHTRVILVPLNHPRYPRDEGGCPRRLSAQLRVMVVRFKVGLIDDVKTIFIA